MFYCKQSNYVVLLARNESNLFNTGRELMIMLEIQEVLRIILGSYRVQLTVLERGCSSPEASALDYQFRDQLYDGFDYSAFAESMMDLVPADDAMDCRDSFGLHYVVFRGRGADRESYSSRLCHHKNAEPQARE